MNTNRSTEGIIPMNARLCFGVLCVVPFLRSCVLNTNVSVTRDAVVVQSNVSLSEKILKLFLWL